jgi:choline kinase
VNRASTTGIILAAGCGTRVSAVTGGVPKGLIDFGRWYPLQWTISTMLEAGVKPIRVVVGFKAADVQSRLLADFPKEPVVFITKDSYQATDTAASFVLGAGESKRPILIIYADTMIARSAMAQLLNDPRPNLLLVDKTRSYSLMDIKVTLDRDRVVGLSKGISAEAAHGESTCVYKLNASCARELSEACRRRQPDDRSSLWFETVLADLLPRVDLRALHCTSDEWCEIDRPEDLLRATRFLSAQVSVGGSSGLDLSGAPLQK